jgi:hypothetical protein
MVAKTFATVCFVDLTVNLQIKSIKLQTKPIKYVNLLIFFVKSLFKQQSTPLPAMKAVISHENF